jgi:hypothetical protein
MARLTADALRLTREERKALRKAGLTPGDLLRLSAGDVVAAGDELISDERAADLVGAACLIALGVSPGFVHGELRLQGVRHRDDLIERDPGEMFVNLMAMTSRTQPGFYDLFAKAIALARRARSQARLRPAVALLAIRPRSGSHAPAADAATAQAPDDRRERPDL